MNIPQSWRHISSIEEIISTFPKRAEPYLGQVYAIEMNKKLKIGKTRNPRTRIPNIIRQAQIYGDCTDVKIFISNEHTNYSQSETILHKHFKNKRLQGELFDITADVFFDQIPDLIFLDDSKVMKEKSDKTVERVINFITGKSPTL